MDRYFTGWMSFNSLGSYHLFCTFAFPLCLARLFHQPPIIQLANKRQHVRPSIMQELAPISRPPGYGILRVRNQWEKATAAIDKLKLGPRESGQRRKTALGLSLDGDIVPCSASRALHRRFLASITTRKIPRWTCKAVRSIATPLMFENLLIDTPNKKNPSKFLKILSSKKGFAKYVVQHLHRVSLTLPGKTLLGGRREKEYEKRLLAAISHMILLKSISSSDVPLRISVSWDGNQPTEIPDLNIQQLLSYFGTGNLEYARILVGPSTHLTMLNIHYSNHSHGQRNPSTPVIYVFFHRCRSSCLTSLSLTGNITITTQESFSLNLDFIRPGFWMNLKRYGVFILERFSLTMWEIDAAMFDYLCSHIGLINLFLRIKEGKTIQG
ncbi:uncharacterized protein BT62DRAFT_1014238 [Guyanagaster necrorhizus]|uniref:Uncharacterized protein n=1 Tax=Guyanagaster necrorhizus TaxID=856835 RepID=A0A9P8AKZ5_9AGAR|nr:uncharacterized protein BT62DRAFT_1014238 [Guyanagaster necrorhizus MCA 3950]KAG7439220.1 hypothetical protein BT62DRAFT_1014238 [Guyanagaster necrorhizus MCA 3950]